MEFVVAGVAVAVLAVIALVVVFIKKGKKAKEVNPRPYPGLTPVEKAQQMSVSEKERLVGLYGGANVPFKISSDISGRITQLEIDFIECYDVKYGDVRSAIKLCQKMVLEEENALLEFEAIMNMLHAERGVIEGKAQFAGSTKKEAPKPNAQAANVPSKNKHMLIKKLHEAATYNSPQHVYIYNPCNILLEREEGTPRLGVELARQVIKDDKGKAIPTLKMEIKTIFFSTDDVRDEFNRYDFDMSDPDAEQAFEKMVRQEELYSHEVHELEVIEKRLAFFNQLCEDDRIAYDKGKKDYKIFPPKAASLKKEPIKQEPHQEVQQEEAKQQVEEAFQWVSSNEVHQE